MQLILTVLSILVIANPFSARSQGTIIFDNKNLTDPTRGGIYHAPVTLPDETPLAGTAFTAGLFHVQSGSLTLLATSTFRSEFGIGFFTEPQLVGVPGVPEGSPATFRVRVWETSAGSYDAA